jgi:16S rRNA (cytosine967-C5)-methyltransferase
VALAALERIERDGAYAHLVVPQLVAALPERDRGFATELAYGATRMRRALDFAVDRFLMRDPPPELRTLLRLGAHQLLHLRVPAHAAVSETVALAPARLRGVTNAVLRRVAAAGPPEWPDVATRLSYPDWIVERLVAELGEADAFAAMERMNEAPPVSVRADGYVQDRSSQWVAELVEAAPGERVVDLCAAPGGKATALAAAGAFVVAADVQRHRIGLVAANAARVGAAEGLAAVAADAAAPPLRPASADRVLLDAPCSGLGALRRRPDARWRVTAADVVELAALQRRLLAAARTVVRPGGVLVYSVCTLTAAESIELDDGMWEPLARPGAPWRAYGRGARVLPHDADTDGMTVLRWRRPAGGGPVGAA